MSDIPFGYCQCGCGKKTALAPSSRARFGHVRGQPVQFVRGHHTRIRSPKSLLERFWEKVDRRGDDECWEWQGTCNKHGYGEISDHGHRLRTHRLAYAIAYGEIPDGLDVLHHCDNPPCCNPKHLFTGTQTDNDLDRDMKGRHNCGRGERNGNVKLTESKVVEIRQLFDAGKPIAEIAVRFGVGLTTARYAAKRKSWRHIS